MSEDRNDYLRRPSPEDAVRRFIERAEDQRDAKVGIVLSSILADQGAAKERMHKLEQENRSLKSKMAYLERRASARLHGLVDLFTKSHE